MQKYSLLLILLFAAVTTFAQPWKDLPGSKTINYMGEPTQVLLKTDTLKPAGSISDMDYENIYLIQNAPGGEKYGYGYVTLEGEPVSLWRYYIKKGNDYELFAEGRKQQLTMESLVVEESIIDQFGDVDYEEILDQIVNTVYHPYIFAGEWHFYYNSNIDKIIVFDDKDRVPFYIIEEADGTLRLVFASSNDLKFAGFIKTQILLDAEGKVTTIISDGINLKLGKNGKAEIIPFQEVY